jgi:DNA mismatch repair protein MutL
VEKIALSRPEIAIRLIVDGNQRLDTAGDGTLESAMYAVFGRDFVKKMIPVKSVASDAIAVDGYICRPDNARPKRNYQNFFINGRYINSRTASAALEQAYTSFIAPEKFPCCVLNIKIAPEAVDVNVHPAKLEVKFSNEKPVFEAVYYTVRAALEANVARPDMTLGKGSPVPHPIHAFVPVEQGKAEQISIDAKPIQPPVKPFERMSAADYTDRMRGYAAASPTPYTRVEAPRAEPIPMPHLERAAAAVAPKNPITAAAMESVARNEEKKGSAPSSEPIPEVPVRITAQTPVPEIVTVEPWRIVGEAFHCYVIVEQGDKLLLVDKHAAHERVLFESLKKKLKEHKNASQMMMIPIELSLVAADIATLEEYRTELEKIGFGYATHGNTALVSEIPAELSAAAATAFLGTLAADLGTGTADATLARDLLFEKALYQAACKAAIKGGREYPPEYLEELVKKLFEIPDITVCPHGRPVAMTLSHANIDRQFRRS